MAPLFCGVLLWDGCSARLPRSPPVGHPDRAANLSGLGALQKLADRTGDTSLLESAITTQWAAVTAAPPGHPGRPAVLANLGAALEKLAERTGATDPLREAVQTCQDAVAAAPAGNRYRPICLTNLGDALHVLGRSTGDTHARTAGSGRRLPGRGLRHAAGDPGQAGRLSNLGAVLEKPVRAHREHHSAAGGGGQWQSGPPSGLGATVDGRDMGRWSSRRGSYEPPTGRAGR